MGRPRRLEKPNCAIFAALVILLVTHSSGLADAKRTYGNNRKTSNPSSNTHVTKPTYSGSSGNSHADVAKLSYPNYNSQPNRPPAAGGAAPGASQPIGWNVPHNQGPPPAYSPTNTGGRTNMHEAPPAYSPGNAAPPGYGNVHSPISATNTHGLQSSYPGGATYHAPGSVPAGATYYPSAGHLPAGATYHAPGAIPAGASYYPSGQFPQGATYHAPAAIPPGATYYGSPAQLPPGATYYSQPPQSSSGLGFGSGLAAGAIGGALLGHALTPTQTRVEAAPASSGNSGGDDKIIIINNGPPGSVTTSQAGSGTTVITTGGVAGAADAMNATAPAASMDSGIPNVPLAPLGDTNATAAAPPPSADQPPAGGIICVPVRVNETDPNDSTKMVEVEKVACYPAPPQPPAANETGAAPLAPMSNAVPEQASQQMQQTPTQATLLPEQSSMRTSGSGTLYYPSFFGLLASSLFYCLMSA